jgi:hypothetical protein
MDPDSGRRQGLFQAAYDLIAANVLSADDVVALKTDLGWFSDELDAPDRFSRSRRATAARRAISWFKSSATEHISRMHAVCRILNEHGLPTTMLTTDRPGYVVYEDEHQIAAEPFADTVT